MGNAGYLPNVDLRVNLQVGTCPASGEGAVAIVVDGIPAGASMPAVVATIVGALQQAFGAPLQTPFFPPVH